MNIRQFLVPAIFFLSTRAAKAAEPICPGGANPRPDIVWCADYSNLANCKTGLEAACWNDNGGLGDPWNGYAIKFGDGPSTTNTAADGFFPPGGEGAGYNGISFPSQLSEASYRFYVKWDHGFLHTVDPTSHHFPTLTLRNGADTCHSYISGDYNAVYGIGWMSENSGCGPESDHIPSNLAPTIITDNFWHVVEMQVVLDTACTDSSQVHGCNGIWRAWFDGTKVLEFTDFNFRGWAPDAMITGTLMPRSQHEASPAWGEHELYANVALSDGAYIGRAQNEGALGTPDPLSPYAVYDAYDAEAGVIPTGACDVSPGYLGSVKTSNQWRSGATLEAAVTHGLYTGACVTQDKAMQVQLAATASGGGQSWERGEQAPQVAVHGWIYLPSGNDYSRPPALSGFSRYGSDGSNWSQYVAMTVAGGRWGVLQRPDGGAPQVVASAGSVTFNAWHEFELMLFKNSTVSLMIDKNQVINAVPLPMTAGWFWGDSMGPLTWSKIIVGVIDFQGSASAAAPFNAYYDDIDVGAVSFWSCAGWGAASCPFFSTTPPPAGTTRPAAPGGLRVL